MYDTIMKQKGCKILHMSLIYLALLAAFANLYFRNKELGQKYALFAQCLLSQMYRSQEPYHKKARCFCYESKRTGDS